MKKRKTKRRPDGPGPEEFIKVWQSATSVAEVMAKCKMSRSAASVRASNYRERGIPLKSFRSPGLDVAALSALVKNGTAKKRARKRRGS